MDKFRKQEIPGYLSSHFKTYTMTPIKKRKVYKIESEGILYRFDPTYSKHLIEVHRLLLENNVNVPKILDVKEFEDSGYVFKLSEWIVGDLWKHIAGNPKIYSLMGEQVAKMNLTKYKHGFIGCTDINSSGVVYNGKDVYLIDLGRSKAKINPDGSVAQMLMKRVVNKERMQIFLDEYSKFRPVDGIIRLLNQRNWRWKKDFRELERQENA